MNTQRECHKELTPSSTQSSVKWEHPTQRVLPGLSTPNTSESRRKPLLQCRVCPHPAAAPLAPARPGRRLCTEMNLSIGTALILLPWSRRLTTRRLTLCFFWSQLILKSSHSVSQYFVSNWKEICSIEVSHNGLMAEGHTALILSSLGRNAL